LTAKAFREHLRSIGHPDGMMMSYLCTNQALLKNFGDDVQKVTERLKEASLLEAKACGNPVQYLNFSQIDKGTIACKILAQDGVPSSWGVPGLSASRCFPHCQRRFTPSIYRP